MNVQIEQNKRIVIFLIAVPVLLGIPLLAMQFTSEVNWNLTDFLVMGILLTILAVTVEVVCRKWRNCKFKITISIFILLCFLLLWAELAVGIFGTPVAGN